MSYQGFRFKDLVLRALGIIDCTWKTLLSMLYQGFRFKEFRIKAEWYLLRMSFLILNVILCNRPYMLIIYSTISILPGFVYLVLGKCYFTNPNPMLEFSCAMSIQSLENIYILNSDSLHILCSNDSLVQKIWHPTPFKCHHIEWLRMGYLVLKDFEWQPFWGTLLKWEMCASSWVKDKTLSLWELSWVCP